MKKNFRVPSVPPYVWPVAVDPWELNGPGGQGGGGGGVAYQNRGDVSPWLGDFFPRGGGLIIMASHAIKKAQEVFLESNIRAEQCYDWPTISMW